MSFTQGVRDNIKVDTDSIKWRLIAAVHQGSYNGHDESRSVDLLIDRDHQMKIRRMRQNDASLHTRDVDAS